MAGDAVKLVAWLLSHSRVRAIFDAAQAEVQKGKTLAYLVAAMSQCVAFSRLVQLKDTFETAVSTSAQHEEVMTAQVGAEMAKKKSQPHQEAG